ncbi:MAG TPA: tail protein X [Longimicrobium sp.]|jgi:phage tail protein X
MRPVSAAHLVHVTKEGERWDQLSWKYYGDPNRYEELVTANPDVPIIPILPGGVSLRVPFLGEDLNVEAFPVDLLPPWKRPAAPVTR